MNIWRFGCQENVFSIIGYIKIYRQIDAKIRKNTPKVKKQQQAVEFEDIAEVIPTEQYKIDKANALKRGIEFYEAWELTHHIVYYVGDQEVRRPNWYYTRVVPKDKTLINKKLQQENSVKQIQIRVF